MDATFWNNWNNILGAIGGAIVILGTLITIITFLPTNYSRWKEKYKQDLGGMFCCFTDPHNQPGTQGGKVHGGMLARTLGEHDLQYFALDLFYAETELKLDGGLNQIFVASHRLNVKMKFFEI